MAERRVGDSAASGLGLELVELGEYRLGVELRRALFLEPEGESSLIQVTLPESGVTDGLTVGAPVSLPGLVARPWQSVFNGRERHGIAYRATAVMPGAFQMAQAG